MEAGAGAGAGARPTLYLADLIEQSALGAPYFKADGAALIIGVLTEVLRPVADVNYVAGMTTLDRVPLNLIPTVIRKFVNRVAPQLPHVLLGETIKALYLTEAGRDELLRKSPHRVSYPVIPEAKEDEDAVTKTNLKLLLKSDARFGFFKRFVLPFVGSLPKLEKTVVEAIVNGLHAQFGIGAWYVLEDIFVVNSNPIFDEDGTLAFIREKLEVVRGSAEAPETFEKVADWFQTILHTLLTEDLNNVLEALKLNAVSANVLLSGMQKMDLGYKVASRLSWAVAQALGPLDPDFSGFEEFEMTSKVDLSQILVVVKRMKSLNFPCAVGRIIRNVMIEMRRDIWSLVDARPFVAEFERVTGLPKWSVFQFTMITKDLLDIIVDIKAATKSRLGTPCTSTGVAAPVDRDVELEEFHLCSLIRWHGSVRPLENKMTTLHFSEQTRFWWFQKAGRVVVSVFRQNNCSFNQIINLLWKTIRMGSDVPFHNLVRFANKVAEMDEADPALLFQVIRNPEWNEYPAFVVHQGPEKNLDDILACLANIPGLEVPKDVLDRVLDAVVRLAILRKTPLATYAADLRTMLTETVSHLNASDPRSAYAYLINNLQLPEFEARARALERASTLYVLKAVGGKKSVGPLGTNDVRHALGDYRLGSRGDDGNPLKFDNVYLGHIAKMVGGKFMPPSFIPDAK